MTYTVSGGALNSAQPSTIIFLKFPMLFYTWRVVKENCTGGQTTALTDLYSNAFHSMVELMDDENV